VLHLVALHPVGSLRHRRDGNDCDGGHEENYEVAVPFPEAPSGVLLAHHLSHSSSYFVM